MEKPEILSSPRLGRLLRAADRVFDYVVLDFPPLLPVADAVVVQDHVDGFVFVVRSRHSPRETIQKAAGLLKPGSIAGVVLNGQHDILPSYGQYAYRHYGKTAVARPKKPTEHCVFELHSAHRPSCSPSDCVLEPKPVPGVRGGISSQRLPSSPSGAGGGRNFLSPSLPAPMGLDPTGEHAEVRENGHARPRSEEP